MLITKFTIPLLKRNFFQYVAVAFNKVDGERLKLVGPDRLCAEWVLKNGGTVRFAEADNVQKDYNTLPQEKTPLRLVEINGTNSAIMALGFDHLKNCNHIHTMILHNCSHMEGDALYRLPYIEKTLTTLQITSCHNVNAKDLSQLGKLKHLKTLTVGDLPYIDDLGKAVALLKQDLPKCDILIPTDGSKKKQ